MSGLLPIAGLPLRNLILNYQNMDIYQIIWVLDYGNLNEVP